MKQARVVFMSKCAVMVRSIGGALQYSTFDQFKKSFNGDFDVFFSIPIHKLKTPLYNTS